MSWRVFLLALVGMLAWANTSSAMPRGRYRAYIGGVSAGVIGHTGFAVPVRNGGIPNVPIPTPGPGNGEIFNAFACEYRMIWENSSGLNARLCYMHEVAPSLFPSCSLNSNQKLASVVVAGRTQIARSCEGMDNNDVPQVIDMLIAGESPSNPGLGLRGVLLVGGLFFESFEA